MRSLIAVTMAAALIVSPIEAQQHTHGEVADGAQGIMEMIQGQAGMMQGHCGMSPGGMMQGGAAQGGMMGGGIMRGGLAQGTMMGGGMMQGGMMDMAGGPDMILGLEKTLGLSQDQVETLQAMAESAHSEVREHLEQRTDARQAAVDVLLSQSPDLDTYEQRLREAADHMVLAHTLMARADVQARGVLDEEQLEKLETSKGMMMEMCSGSRENGMMPHGGQADSGQGR